jgi:iron(III) transport system permease protein
MAKGRSGTGRPNGARIWLIAGWCSVLLLPWHGIEDERAPVFLWNAFASPQGPATPFWLIASLAILAVASLAELRRANAVLIAATLLGLARILVEAVLMRRHDPIVGAGDGDWLSLGWGAGLYGLVMLVLLAYALARRGWCKGDAFTLGTLFAVCGSILVFVGYPVLCILSSAFEDNDGNLALPLFFQKITDDSIWGLACLSGGRTCGVAWNSLAQAVVVGVLSTVLGLAFALIGTRTRFPFPRLLKVISILPIITPPFVIGLALILIFGRAGMVTTALHDWFDLPRSRWLYGMAGLTIAQLLAFTPIAYLVLVGIIQGVSPSLEEAAQTLRGSRWRTFVDVTWPLIRPGLANAFLIGFIESLADFGNPMMIGGNFRVLSVSIYFAVVGAAQDQGQAAVQAIVLLLFTLSAFLLQRWWLGRRSYVSVSGKGDGGIPGALPRGLHIACLGIVIPWLALTVAVYAIILIGGFVKNVGSDYTPTLQYFLTAFGMQEGDHGWFFSGSAWNSLITTLEVAFIAMFPTAALGIMTAYLLNRHRFVGRDAFEFLTMMSFAIPGTVIGISYILAFNVPPIQLTGTAVIMVMAFVFRNMPVGIRAGIASLSQIDRSLDEASLTLGANSATTMRRVIFPILRPAVAVSMVYAFVRAITSISAVIFLVSGEYNLATVYIVGRAEYGEYGLAIVYSAVLIVIMLAALIGIQAAVGERRIGRRTRMATPTTAMAEA